MVVAHTFVLIISILEVTVDAFLALLSACLICDCGPPQPMPDMIISANMNNTPATPTGRVSCLSHTCTSSDRDFKVFGPTDAQQSHKPVLEAEC